MGGIIAHQPISYSIAVSADADLPTSAKVSTGAVPSSRDTFTRGIAKLFGTVTGPGWLLGGCECT